MDLKTFGRNVKYKIPLNCKTKSLRHYTKEKLKNELMVIKQMLN